MSDTVDGRDAKSADESQPEEGADSVTTTSQDDPADTDHPTGHAQAAENEDLELPG